MSTNADAVWLVDQFRETKAAVKSLAQPQLGTSSIEQGAIEEYDEEGTLTTVTGTQFDGTHTAASLAGPQPPQPSQPSLTPGAGQVLVRWNGLFEDGALSPMDFSHVSVHASREEAFDPDNDTQVAQIRGESGDSATVLLETGEWWILLVAVSQSGKWSDPCEPVMVEVPEAVTVSDWADSKIEIDGQIQEVWATASGKNKIYNSTVDPTSTDEGVDGDRWQVWTTLAPGGKLTATWRHDGTAWVKEALDEVYLPLVNIGSGTYGELTGSRLIAKSVKADALEALMVLANTIVAGNPNGTHARMSPLGFEVMASPDGVSPPTPVVRMGVSSTGDYFGVVKPSGELAASISSDGAISGSSVSSDGDISMAGNSLTGLLNAKPNGVVAWGGQPVTSLASLGSGGGEIGLMEIALDTTQDDVTHLYRFLMDTIVLQATGSGTVGVRLRYTTDGSAPTINSQIAAYNIQRVTSANGDYLPVQLTRLFQSVAKQYLRILVTLFSTSPSLTVFAGSGAAQGSVFLSVEDLGPTMAESAIVNGGGGGTNPPPPPPAKVTKVQTWTATASRTYDGAGNPYTFDTAHVYQGQSPAGYGDLRGMVLFPTSIASTLSGATVNWVKVYAYFDHWYYNSGGNAKFGRTAATSIPATLPSTTLSVTSAGWPKPGGRWVTWPASQNNMWRDGTIRGITLGGTGGGYTEYGYAHDFRVQISYTK